MRFETVGEFRVGLKDAFDTIDNGGEVIIIRGRTRYQLTSARLATKSPLKIESTIPTQQIDLQPVTYAGKTVHTEVGFDQYGLPTYKDVPMETYTIDEGISAIQGRTIVQILTDINKRKQTLTQDLNYCQDADTKLQIEADGKEDLDALWAEYKEAKVK